MEGNLIIKPICAKLKKDYDLFTKMDPYCKITLGHKVAKTKTSKNSGKSPNWQDSLSFNIKGQSQFHIALYDRDWLTRDDFIGETTINLLEVYNKSHITEWYNLNRKGKNAGKIMIVLEFIPKVSNIGFQMQNYGYPQNPNNQYPPQMTNNQYSPQMPNIQYPPQMPNYGYPPQMTNYGYPPQIPNYGYPPQIPNNQYQPQLPYGFPIQKNNKNFQTKIPNNGFQMQNFNNETSMNNNKYPDQPNFNYGDKNQNNF